MAGHSAQHENGRGPRGVEEHGEELTLRGAAAALRRHVWPILLFPLLAFTAAWLYLSGQEQTYTAEVLFRQNQTENLLGPSAVMGRESSEPVRAQVEIIRSRAVLRPVVDSLQLAFVLEKPEDVSRATRLVEVDIEGSARPGLFQLEQRQGTVRLKAQEASGWGPATAPAGEWVHGPGFRVRFREGASADEPLVFRIMQPETAIRRLRGRLRLDRIPETTLIRASYTDPDPRLAAEVVEAVAASHQRHAAAAARQEASRRRVFLERQLEQTEDSLRQAQESVLSYQEASGALDPAEEGRAALDRVMAAEQSLRELRFQVGTLERLNQALGEGPASDEVLRRVLVLGSGLIPTAPQLYERLQQLKTQRAQLTAGRFGYTSEGAQVEVLDSLMADVRQELRAITAEALGAAQERTRIAEGRVRELRAEVAGVPARSGRLARLQQSMQGIQRTYDLLQAKYYEARISEAVEGGNVEIVDPAVIPVIPDPSNSGRTLFLAVFLGLVAGVGTALLLDYFDRKVYRREDVERATDLPLLTAIPAVASANGAGRPTLKREDRSQLAEAFRSLYTMIRFTGAEWPRVIAVTSPEAAAGKSTVAANLGIVMSGNHPRILVVDADLARPMQHEIFGLPLQPGLSDVLIGEGTLEEVVHRDETHRVDILTAGTPVPHSADLLGQDAFRKLIGRLADEYDVVLVDTAPTLALADTSALASTVGGILLVARVNSTNRDALRASVQQLRHVGGNLLGVVLNGVSRSGGYYGYGYVEGYGERGGDDAGGGGRLAAAGNRLQRIFGR